MSPANSGKKPGGPHRKPRADVYTVLLVIALIALLSGILCLYFEMDMYEWKIKGGPAVSVAHPTAVVMAGQQRPAGRGQRPAVSGTLAACFPLIPDP